MTDQKTLSKLRNLLVTRFNEEELRTLCFELGVDYDDLPGQGKADKARELVTYHERRDCVVELIKTIKKLRSDIKDALNLDELYRRGVRAMLEGQWATAIKYLEQVVAWDPLYKNAAELLAEAKQKQELQLSRHDLRQMQRVRLLWQSQNSAVQAALVAALGIIVALGCLVSGIPQDIAQNLLATPDFTGKVCQILDGWDTNTIFLRQAEFETVGLPIGSRGTVAVRDTDKVVENVMLSLNSDLRVCSVRLSRPLRNDLNVDNDTDIEPESERPNRQFDITQMLPPTNENVTSFLGKVCMIRTGQYTNTVFLRKAEFDAFGVPAGTTVSVTVLDTDRTLENVYLGLDSDISICVVRLSKSLREALGVADDTDIELPEDRPDRQFSIHLPQP